MRQKPNRRRKWRVSASGSFSDASAIFPSPKLTRSLFPPRKPCAVRMRPWTGLSPSSVPPAPIQRPIPWLGVGGLLRYTIVQSDSVKQSDLGRSCSLVPREPPLPQASVSRNLLGVVVPDPGVPGRREWGGWSFSAPFSREGPRGLPLRVAGAAGLTGRDAARGARAAALLSRLWSAGGGDGAESGAGLSL